MILQALMFTKLGAPFDTPSGGEWDDNITCEFCRFGALRTYFTVIVMFFQILSPPILHTETARILADTLLFGVPRGSISITWTTSDRTLEFQPGTTPASGIYQVVISPALLPIQSLKRFQALVRDVQVASVKRSSIIKARQSLLQSSHLPFNGERPLRKGKACFFHTLQSFQTLVGLQYTIGSGLLTVESRPKMICLAPRTGSSFFNGLDLLSEKDLSFDFSR